MLIISKLNSRSVMRLITARKKICIIAIMMVTVGVLMGCLFEKNLASEERLHILSYINPYLLFQEGSSSGLFPILLSSLRNNFFFFLVILLSGLTVVFFPLAFAALLLKSASIGFAAALLVESLLVKGILITIFALFLPSILLLPTMTLAVIASSNLASAAINFPGRRTRRTRGHKKNPRQSASSFISLNIIFALLILSGCLTEAFTCRLTPLIFS